MPCDVVVFRCTMWFVVVGFRCATWCVVVVFKCAMWGAFVCLGYHVGSCVGS